MGINIPPDWTEKGNAENTTTNKALWLSYSRHMNCSVVNYTTQGVVLTSDLNLTMICRVGTSKFIFTDEGKRNERM